MTRSAYELGTHLPARQRVALLERLLYTMGPEVMAAEKRQWAEELFTLAQGLPSGPSRSDSAEAATAVQQNAALRNQAIATAAARLALYDCDRALALLDTLPSEHGMREDARTMAARLVFATYIQRHGPAGAQTLLNAASRWGERGGFPYGATEAALARLSANEEAADGFFRQELAQFERGQEGAYGIAEFAELLERAVATEAISEDAAEEAGKEVVRQAAKLAAGGTAPFSAGADGKEQYGGAADGASGASGAALPSADAQQRLAQALNDVHAAAPKAYAWAVQQWPALAHWQQVQMALPRDDLKIDPELQTLFAELGQAIRLRSGPEAERDLIARGLKAIDERYKPGSCPLCDRPDRQSWAFVSLAAYGAPFSIATQLNAIADPFWHAYFLAIAAEEVGEPTRVADPTARRVLVKEEAEPEQPDE